jgi:hypothetical protein
MLAEVSVIEQRLLAVREVLDSGVKITDIPLATVSTAARSTVGSRATPARVLAAR